MRHKPPPQIPNDFFRIVKPLTLARRIGDLQTRHFGLTAFTGQNVAVSTGRLRIDTLNVQRQASHFLPYFHAKRAGFVLVQNQALAILVDQRLCSWRAGDALWASEIFFEQSTRYIIDEMLRSIGIKRVPPANTPTPGIPFKLIRKAFRLAILPVITGLASLAGDGGGIHAVFRKNQNDEAERKM